MKNDLVIGIDPGVSNGGIAIKREFTNTVRCPRDYYNMEKLFSYYRSISHSPVAFIEVVQLFIQDNDTPGKAFGLQKLFKHYNSLKNALTSQRIPYVMVYPQSWQSYLKLKTKGESDKERKARYKSVAQELFPEVKTTLWNSDALLLLQFGLKKLTLDPAWIMERIVYVEEDMFN